MTAGCPTAQERARKFAGLDFTPAQEPAIRRTFSSWIAMLSRCMVAADTDRMSYRRNGTLVAERWFTFAQFVADMGMRPAGTTLDRIDNNGHYEPGNCRWADAVTQARNTSRNVRAQIDGESLLVVEIAARTGMAESTISRRIKQKRPTHEIVSREPLPNGKLCASQVLEIRRLGALGHTNTSIAAQFGVTHSNVSQILRRVTWRGV